MKKEKEKKLRKRQALIGTLESKDHIFQADRNSGWPLQEQF